MNFYDYQELEEKTEEAVKPVSKPKKVELSPEQEIDNLLEDGESGVFNIKASSYDFNKLYVKYKEQRRLHKLSMKWNSETNEIIVNVK